MRAIRFGTEGWRAVLADDYTFDNVRIVARAAARWFKRQPKQAPVAIGRGLATAGPPRIPRRKGAAPAGAADDPARRSSEEGGAYAQRTGITNSRPLQCVAAPHEGLRCLSRDPMGTAHLERETMLTHNLACACMRATAPLAFGRPPKASPPSNRAGLVFRRVRGEKGPGSVRGFCHAPDDWFRR